jgi:ribosome-associated protein
MDSWQKALCLVESALDKKAYDLVVLEVRDLTSIADYFIICSGRSDRQVQSLSHGIEQSLGEKGVSAASIEGYTRGQWVLMDFSDVIVHIFYQPVREFYDLEGLWADAPCVELPEPYSTLRRQFLLENESTL